MIKSTEDDPFLFAGTFIIEGSCQALVTCVGRFCTRGDWDLKHDTGKSGLEKHLFNLTKTFTYIGIVAAAIIMITALLIIFLQATFNDDFGVAVIVKKIAETLTLTIIIIIVAVPEGLPMTVSMSLAFSYQKMFTRDHILVRDLKSIEKMGQINEICTGKTGTLTTE